MISACISTQEKCASFYSIRACLLAIFCVFRHAKYSWLVPTYIKEYTRENTCTMQDSPHAHDVEGSALFFETEAAVGTMLCEIEKLLASESYDEASAESVKRTSAAIHDTVECAKHNDGSMPGSYAALQTSTSEKIENMLDNRHLSQCISESEAILHAMEEVLVAQQFSLPAVQRLFQGMNTTWRDASTMVAAHNKQRCVEWSVRFTLRAEARLNMQKETARALEQMQECVHHQGEIDRIHRHVASMLAPTGNPDMHSFSTTLYRRFLRQVPGYHYTPEPHFASLSLR